jgi:retinol dehydrogenase-14
MYRLVRLFFQSPEKGAETSVYLASSAEAAGSTGKYFIKKRAVASSPESYDEGVARRLWATSAHLTGLAE